MSAVKMEIEFNIELETILEKAPILHAEENEKRSAERNFSFPFYDY